MGQVAATASGKGARHAALSLGLEAPTPERAMKGAAILDKDGLPTHSLGDTPFRVESTSFVEIRVTPGEQPRSERVTEKRIRMVEGVFERLKARGELARDDADLNRILGAAGFHYARLHHGAGLEALKAFDITKGFTTNRGQSEAAADRRIEYLQAFQAADDALSGAAGLHALPRALVLRKVILEDMALVDVGRSICEAKDKAVCAGIALHELKNGLRALARHFGYLVD